MKKTRIFEEIIASDLTWKKHADKLEEIFNGNVA
jgi:hypothetical protein